MPAYLDHAATAPLCGPALAAITAELTRYGNPSALHGAGRRARMVVETARDEIAAAAGADPSEVVLTGGGTEADNLAVKGLYWARRAADPRRRRILTSTVEHHAVSDTVEWLTATQGAEAVWLPVDERGILDLDALDAALAEDPASVALVTVMWANNEVGAVQPVAEIVRRAERYGVPVHADAVQAFGAVPVDFAASGLAAASISGHKIGGPLGIGALLLGRSVAVTPVLHGGGQERDVRSGTLDAPAAAGFAAAATAVVGDLPAESARIAGLRDALVAGVLERVPAAVLRGPASGPERLPGNAHFTFTGCEGDSLLFLLDAAGVQSSAGSACSAGVPRASHVLLALGLDEATARGGQRFSLGHTSTEDDVRLLLDELPGAVAKATAAGMAGHVPDLRAAGR